MPGGDRKGPMGASPLTGRRTDYCSVYITPGYENLAAARLRAGYGFRGGGRGWRNLYFKTGMPGWQRFCYAAPVPQEESTVLKKQADLLKGQLDAINKRLEQLK